MPVRQTSIGVGSTNSSTFFPLRPVENGRDRGALGLTILTNGTSGATTLSNLRTSCERPPAANGLTVTTTVTSGAVATAVVVAPGTGYRIGQRLFLEGSVSGFTRTPVLEVTSVGSNGAVTGLAIIDNGGAGGGALTAANAFPVNPQAGPQGLRVNVTAAGGVVTAVAIPTTREANGRGYRIGDIITVLGAGTGSAVTLQVTSLTG